MRLKLVCKRAEPIPSSGGIYHPGDLINVVNAETGELIDGVVSVAFNVPDAGVTRMVVEVVGAEADIETEGVIVTRERKP